MWRVSRRFVVKRAPFEFDVVLDHDSVEHYREVRRPHQLTICTELRSIVNDIVRLPLARFATRIDHRWALLVKSPTLSIEVGRVLITIEYLDLIPVAKENSTIASP